MIGVNLKGLGVAMITPFDSEMNVDFGRLEALTEHIVSGADYLVVCGTTGETPTLTKKEKLAVLKCVMEVNKGRLPIVYGAGGNDTRVAIEEVQKAEKLGVDAILSVVPYYNKPTAEGIYAHFSAIANCTSLPIVLYNIPGRTGVNMLPETTLKLARKFKNIVAVKEASADLDQMKKIIAEKTDDFDVISGDDGITLELVKAGGAGVISVLGNAYPKEWAAMVGYALEGKYAEAGEINDRFMQMNTFLFVDGNPAGIKAVCTELGLVENYLRLPMMPARPETIEKLKAEM